ncbi:hypothetical protein DB88DRAFT_177344 [Papiliotrema laurentii]|uniref:Uncharacterized protein n=1 Tax=Papiliotrema laurentii TaxID=5418 RepID=A0AAD9FUX3_PAPLA|nr:hypothetical protein DB88DRAFT_177344 [Papiliotrema laurentii]
MGRTGCRASTYVTSLDGPRDADRVELTDERIMTFDGRATFFFSSLLSSTSSCNRSDPTKKDTLSFLSFGGWSLLFTLDRVRSSLAERHKTPPIVQIPHNARVHVRPHHSRTPATRPSLTSHQIYIMYPADSECIGLILLNPPYQTRSSGAIVP